MTKKKTATRSRKTVAKKASAGGASRSGKKRAPKRKAKVPDGMQVKRSYAGLGLFATRPFKKGEVVIEYVGRVISKEEEYESNSKYLFEVNARKTIDGRPYMNIAGYINHSCRPNCEPEIRKGRVFIEAIRAIPAGEEFTYDYGDEYFDEHIKPYGCRCPKCAAKKRVAQTR